jgi:hypothetical protein
MSGPVGEARRSLDDHLAAHYLSQYRTHGNGGICPIHGVARCQPWAEAHAALAQEGMLAGGQPNSQAGR